MSDYAMLHTHYSGVAAAAAALEPVVLHDLFVAGHVCSCQLFIGSAVVESEVAVMR